ncbi:hypothetical protein [Chloroflexus aggregans]|nr:hypothetical protein [Chloroflexus aggregans]
MLRFADSGPVDMIVTSAAGKPPPTVNPTVEEMLYERCKLCSINE